MHALDGFQPKQASMHHVESMPNEEISSSEAVGPLAMANVLKNLVMQGGRHKGKQTEACSKIKN